MNVNKKEKKLHARLVGGKKEKEKKEKEPDQTKKIMNTKKKEQLVDILLGWREKKR